MRKFNRQEDIELGLTGYQGAAMIYPNKKG